MNDYKELIEMLRHQVINDDDASEIADAIEQLVKAYEELDKAHGKLFVEYHKVKEERDAYAKAFRITTSYEPLINHAVVKVDYNAVNDCDREELMRAIAYRLARVIEDARSKGGRA